MTEQHIEPARPASDNRPGFLRWRYGTPRRACTVAVQYALMLALIMLVDSTLAVEPDGFWANAGAILATFMVWQGFDYRHEVVQQAKPTVLRELLKYGTGVFVFGVFHAIVELLAL